MQVGNLLMLLEEQQTNYNQFIHTAKCPIQSGPRPHQSENKIHISESWASICRQLCTTQTLIHLPWINISWHIIQYWLHTHSKHFHWRLCLLNMKHLPVHQAYINLNVWLNLAIAYTLPHFHSNQALMIHSICLIIWSCIIIITSFATARL